MNNLLSGLFTELSDPLLLVDRSGLILSINTRARSLLLPADERNIFIHQLIVLHREDPLFWSEITTAPQKSHLLYLKTGQGQPISCNARIFPASDSSFYLLLQDVTTLSRANQNSKKFKSFNFNEIFRYFFEHNNDGVVLYNSDGVITCWNHSMEKLTGIPARNATGCYIWDIQKLLTQENGQNSMVNQKIKADTLRLIEKIKPGNKITCESVFYSLSGKAITVFNSTTAFPLENDLIIASVYQDITAPKDIINRLVLTENKFAAAFHNNFCPMAVVSFPDGIIQDVNSSLIVKCHKSREELVGNKITGLQPLIKQRDFERISVKLLKNNAFENYPVEITNEDGSSLHLLLSGQKIMVDHERIVLLTALDITAEKELQFSMSEKESRYRAIFENSIMGVVVLDRSLTIRDFNQIFSKIAGFETIDLRNNKLTDFIHPVETELVETLFAQTLAGSSHEMITQELQLIRKDGTIRTATTYLSSYFDDRLRQNVLLVMFDDISEKKKIAEELIKSEQKHRMIAEYVLDVIWISDLNLNHTFVSPSIYNFQGYDPVEFLSVSLEDSLTAESLSTTRQKLADSYSQILSGEAKAADLKTTMELIYRHKNGSLVHGEVTAVFIIDSKGNPTGILGVTRDVTARKQHEADLMVAKDKAEEANRLKSMFLANVSHEIRTPVSGIIGLTSRLIKHAPNDFFHRQLKSLLNSAEMLLTIINDLLDVSRIEAGKLELENIDFNFRQMLSGVTDLFTHRIQEKKLYFHYAIDEKIPRIIQGDPVRIGQILINILGNAFKFTENGGVELTVTRINKKISDRFGIRFSISDTGQGIAPDKIPLIFKAFTQADVSHTRKYGGTGLGLTIAGSLIDMMGGKIRVKSAVGEGSLFEYELFLKAVNSPLRNKIQNIDDSPITPQSLSGLKILIAEDNDLNCEYLRMLLEDYGITVVICSDGEAAYQEFCRGTDINGIILDVQMPKMDGYQVAKAIRESTLPHHQLPLLGLSASGFPEEEKMAIESGMNQFMIKPAKEEKLLIWLNSLKNIQPLKSIQAKTKAKRPNNHQTDTLQQKQIFDLNELLEKNSRRLSSLLPLVQLMLDTGRTYLNDLYICTREARTSEIQQLAHKFRGRISIFDSPELFELLSQLEKNCSTLNSTEQLALLENLSTKYQLFENQLQELKKIIITNL